LKILFFIVSLTCPYPCIISTPVIAIPISIPFLISCLSAKV
jgi:hypothetical protein